MTAQPSLSLSELLPKARAGDDAAWGLLLERYRNYLTLEARGRLNPRLQSKVGAADVVQETFLRAHRFRDTFLGTTEVDVTNWLMTILQSRLAEVHRKYLHTGKNNVTREAAPARDPDESWRALAQRLAASNPSPGRQAALRESQIRLADALAKIPERYREAVVMRYLEGLTPTEIALRTGGTPDSVQKNVRRGLIALAQFLGDDA